MSEKIVVPDGMLMAAHANFLETFPCGDYSRIHQSVFRMMLEAALRWLADNPIVPTDEQVAQAAEDAFCTRSGWGPTAISNARAHFSALQRRMFVVAEPEVPEAIKDLLDKEWVHCESIDAVIIESYRRGYSEGCSSEAEHRDPRFDTSSN